jgi:hypothetical protein
MDLDTRSTALVLARARAIVGLVMLAVPGLVGRIAFGESSPRFRAVIRMLGVRDLVIGVGGLTSVKEGTQDAEWIGMGAFSDGVDGLVTLLSPGLPFSRRLMAPGELACAALGLKLSRELADARLAAATPD